MSETSEIVTPALDALNGIPGVVCLRLHAGKVRVARGWMQQNRGGCPDLLCVIRGHAVFMEAKLPGQRPTEEQIREHARLKQSGATVVVIHSVRDAVDTVRLLLRRGAA